MSPHKCRVCDDCRAYVSVLEVEVRELKRRIAKARKQASAALSGPLDRDSLQETPGLVALVGILGALAAPRKAKRK